MKASLPMRLFWGFALAVNLGAVALDVWLFFYATHRWYQPILGAANLGCAAFFVWRFIWDFRQRRTLKSSPPSQSLSSFLAFQSNGPTPLPSQPSSPSTSRSLPSVTIDQPVVGFRQWKLIGGNGLQLLPLAYDAWPWGATTIAKCGMAQSHPAPQAGCSCGLYAHGRQATQSNHKLNKECL